jgi:hypothetical protein
MVLLCRVFLRFRFVEVNWKIVGVLCCVAITWFYFNDNAILGVALDGITARFDARQESIAIIISITATKAISKSTLTTI